MAGRSTLDRRALIGAGALFAGAMGVPLSALRAIKLDEADAPTQRQRALARQVAQLVIPRNDTPGGADVGADAFLILALAHGLDGTRAPQGSAAIQGAYGRYGRRDGTLDHLAWLEGELDRQANGDIVGAPLSRQQAALEAVDAAAFASRDTRSPWVSIKGLLLTGYYTSEAGGSKELRFDPVPGRFDPDLPLGPADRAWSSDWTAVEFG